MSIAERAIKQKICPLEFAVNPLVGNEKFRLCGGSTKEKDV